jgi:hypothetical protein
VSRLGTVLIPLLAGFLLTVAVVSWRSGWWQRDAFQSPAATQPVVEVRPPSVRIVRVHPSAAPAATAPAAPAPAPEALPEPVSQPAQEPPVPRTDPARKFAHGSVAGGD